jgi:hypothetical protein
MSPRTRHSRSRTFVVAVKADLARGNFATGQATNGSGRSHNHGDKSTDEAVIA